MLLNGIDCIKNNEALFKNKRLGLITSISGVTKRLTPTIDILHQSFKLTALFSPEHGVRGNLNAGALVDTYTDDNTDLPVYSLYRKASKHFTEDMLAQVDAVVYDVQDVGVRYYTFISTMLNALEDCAAAGKELIILDRINPLGGETVEGNLLKFKYQSFVGAYPLCMRYALTVGEIANMVNLKAKLDCKLHIVQCEGWRRREMLCNTDSIWMMPSLGMPRFETALLYAGMCLFEGTNLSEGRGTSCPFELIGAPYINASLLAKEMNVLQLDGVLFTAAYFTPTASKHAGIACGGVHVHITDVNAFKSVETGLCLLYRIRLLYANEFAFLPPVKDGSRPFISLLMGDNIFETEPPELDALLSSFKNDELQFKADKEQYHLYN